MTRSLNGSKLLRGVWLLAVGLAGCETPNIPTDADAVSAVAVAYAFLEAIGRADTLSLRLHSIPEARLVALSDNPTQAPRITHVDDFLLQVQADSGRFEERMWEPQVHVQGRLATVWAPYDFHVDGAFRHCGIDTFSLVRMAHDWKVFSIAYTVVREDCPDSPMGPIGT